VKKNLLTVYTLITLLSITCFSACKKGIKDPVTLDKAAGKWSINAIRMQAFNGKTLLRDSTVPWRPVVENYVSFDGISNLNYCFNSANSTAGDYKLLANDSIILRVGNDNRRWKILLLTSTNFNIETTTDDDDNFPGATVVTFQGFVR
jgi:hypothetical protein